MSLAQLREDLVSSLDGVFSLVSPTLNSFPPELIDPPAIVVVPDDPYVEPKSIGSQTRADVYFRLTLLVGITDNESNLRQMENLIAGTYAALPKGYRAGSCSQPKTVQVGASDLLATEIRVATTTELEEG
jgi:hypothetical protein